MTIKYCDRCIGTDNVESGAFILQRFNQGVKTLFNPDLCIKCRLEVVSEIKKLFPFGVWSE